ncbi:tRNA (N6-threonylcarbamoyladenosine(37)-N6)-methyltransferase TrmO [candidate division WOR-3 bacterium]|nr:tRNA (N6-threonylcarbamoyladenosine(37)-N6)-methyltransferase TrmO [candidate division WOR-3 bacterium]
MAQGKTEAIGVIKSIYKTRDEAPHQGKDEVSEIEILQKYCDGLKDIERFSHLHIFYLLHQSGGFSLSVTTPWDTEQHGLFATRSPNRPTPLGYAVVELIERKGNVLKVKGIDAINGTPVLDIKPYIPGLDAKPQANRGWFEDRKLTFTPRVYEYKTKTEWKVGKEGVLKSEQKHDVRVGCPPEFGGKPVYWSPEHLFVSSVEVCIMTTFLDLIKKYKCSIVAYKSKAEGLAQLKGGIFKFNKIEIKPIVVIEKSNSEDEVMELLIKAKRRCMVSNSLNVEVTMKPEIRIHPVKARMSDCTD